MNILDLDDATHKLIFKKLTLQEHFRLRSTCSRWCNIVSDIFAEKRELCIFGAPDKLREFYLKAVLSPVDTMNNKQFTLNPNNTLVFYHKRSFIDCRVCNDLATTIYSADGAAFLALLFPNIENLILSLEIGEFLNEPSLDIGALVAAWAPNLTSFLLDCPVIPKENKAVLVDKKSQFVQNLTSANRLWCSFAAMTNLKHLHLYNAHAMREQSVLPILPQLESLTLHEVSNDLLKKFLPKMPNKLTTLRISQREGAPLVPGKEYAHLGTNVTNFTFLQERLRDESGLGCFPHLQALTHADVSALVEIEESELDFEALVEAVASLDHLQSLVVNLALLENSYSDFFVENENECNPDKRNASLPTKFANLNLRLPTIISWEFCQADSVRELTLVDQKHFFLPDEERIPFWIAAPAHAFPQLECIKYASKDADNEKLQMKLKMAFKRCYSETVQLKFVKIQTKKELKASLKRNLPRMTVDEKVFNPCFACQLTGRVFQRARGDSQSWTRAWIVPQYSELLEIELVEQSSLIAK